MTIKAARHNTPPSMLSKGAFVLAALALGLSLWTAISVRGAGDVAQDAGDKVASSPAAMSTRPELDQTGTLSPPISEQTALSVIEDRVMELEQRQHEISARLHESESAPPTTSIDEPQRYAELISPEPGVTVMQGENGAVFAINSDPALTGKVIEIEVRRADGSVGAMTIMVPEPDY